MADSSGGDVRAEDGAPEDEGTDEGGSACAAVDGRVLGLPTSDGIELEADLYRPAGAGELGAVLLHMIPPSNDRSNYPRAFIDALTERCITVLNVDRRGAGGSGGNARDAYTGPSGVLDAAAAVSALEALDGGPSRLVLVGASNGTTTVLDYVARAQGWLPEAAVFLSGGTYTENQNEIESLGELRSLFLYPVSEAAWNERDETQGATRTFQSFSPGAHGTRLFQSNPETIAVVADFIQPD